MTYIHSCGYHCDKPGCIKAQRDDLVKKFIVNAREPLTEEEMSLCFTSTNTSEPLSEGWPGLDRFARAIEKAHGIGGES